MGHFWTQSSTRAEAVWKRSDAHLNTYSRLNETRYGFPNKTRNSSLHEQGGGFVQKEPRTNEERWTMNEKRRTKNHAKREKFKCLCIEKHSIYLQQFHPRWRMEENNKTDYIDIWMDAWPEISFRLFSIYLHPSFTRREQFKCACALYVLVLVSKSVVLNDSYSRQWRCINGKRL